MKPVARHAALTIATIALLCEILFLLQSGPGTGSLNSPLKQLQGVWSAAVEPLLLWRDLRDEPSESALRQQRIEQLAASNRPDDALQLYRLATACVGVKSLQGAQGFLPADPSEAAEDPCDGMAPRHLDARLGALERALDAGVRDAAVAWFEEGPGDRRAEDAAVLAWKRTAIERLGEQARMGDVNSIAYLAAVHENGAMAPRDLRQSLTYHVALAEVRQARGQNTVMLDQAIARIRRELAAGEATAALAEGRTLAAACCAAAVTLQR